MDTKGEKSQKQHMGILEKIARLSDIRKEQVKTIVEQAVSKEQNPQSETPITEKTEK